MPAQVRVLKVDDAGVVLLAAGDRPVDVDIDGRRIWTFWSRRDTGALGVPLLRSRWPLRRAPWPDALKLHLNGTGRITVRDTASGSELYERTLTLGNGNGEIAVKNRNGVDLGIDKSGRLVPTFATRSAQDIAALLDATEAVIAALRDAGLEPFLAYGTLLGAVREGAVIGHDSDADLGYVSRFTDPVDVARESFQVQRVLQEQGWQIVRYSGAAFKIQVTEADVTRGLDVFGGFLDGDRLYLMGEVGTPFEPAWIHPLTTARLDGREMPVPAEPERLLEAMYGPGWRTPDPAFKFTTPRRTVHAFNDWFRGTQPHIRHWDKRAYILANWPVKVAPSKLAERAQRFIARHDCEVLDIGAGRGVDAVWFARQGTPVTAYDYVPRLLDQALVVVAEEDLPFEARYLNLTEWRSVLGEGARLAHHRVGDRRRVVLARNVADATSAFGAESIARLCKMALRPGDRLFATAYLPVVEPDEENPLPEWVSGRFDPDLFLEHLRKAGAVKLETKPMRIDGHDAIRVVATW